MPIYEYRCGSCGSLNEYLVGVCAADQTSALSCESCGSSQLTRVQSRINIGAPLASFGACADGPGCAAGQAGGCCGAGGCGHAH